MPPLIAEPLLQPHLHKFPRTHHLKNLGSASRDDLMVADPTALLQHRLWVEERLTAPTSASRSTPETFQFVVQTGRTTSTARTTPV